MQKTEVFDPTEGMEGEEFDPTGGNSTYDTSSEEEDVDLMAPPQKDAPKRSFKQLSRATEKTKKTKGFFDDDLPLAKPRQTLAYEADIDPLGLFVEQATTVACLFDMIVSGKKMSS